MPTSDPVQQEPHHARQLAESFGSNPERYDRARPRYPDALIERLLATAARPAPPDRAAEFLDVGCGTGIVARQLQDAGARVLGVEPDPRMAEFARQTGVAVEEATFETWEPAGRTFDAVVAGQTWHWVDPVAGAAKAAAVLRPGGLLALFWNGPSFPPELGEAVSATYRKVLPDLPFLHQAGAGASGFEGFQTRTADGIREAGAFGEPDGWRFTWQRDYTTAEWLDGIPTAAGHDRFAPEQLRELMTGIGAAIDGLGGRFTVTFTTIAVTAVAHPGAGS